MAMCPRPESAAACERRLLLIGLLEDGNLALNGSETVACGDDRPVSSCGGCGHCDDGRIAGVRAIATAIFCTVRSDTD
jgi:hypothetical protein